MRCERCGRDNPEHLTFCEDCGFALARRKEAARPAAPAQAIVRPQAPSFEIGPPAAVSSPDDGLTCKACRTRNEPGHRFCVACGAPLGSSPPAARPTPNPPAAPSFDGKPPTRPDGLAAVSVSQAASQPQPVPIAAAPMVAVAASPTSQAPTFPCPRCRTPASPGTMYCRVCGFALAQAPTENALPAQNAAAPSQAFSPAAPVAQAAPGPTPQVAPPAPVPASPPAAPPSPSPADAGTNGASAKLLTKTVAIGAPGVRTSGRLVVLAKDGTDGASFSLTGDAIDIGSREGAIVLSDDPYLSARHARIQEERGTWWLVDLGSVNGVYLRVRKPWQLTDGDLILLGQEVLRFEVVMDAEQGLRPATQHGTAIFGTPQMPRFARLCQRTVEGVTRDVFHLHRAETSLGRETADIVFTDDPFLSRRHAVIRHDATTHAFTLEDAGSSNGTFAAIRGRVPLSDGDILRMGLHVLRIDLASTANAGDGASSHGGDRGQRS